MATITITVPDVLIPRLKSAMRSKFPDVSALSDIAAFKAVTASFWKQVLADYERAEVERVKGVEYEATVVAAYATATADAVGIT